MPNVRGGIEVYSCTTPVNYHMKWEQVKGTFLWFLHIYKWS